MFIICFTLLTVLFPAYSYLTPEDTSLQKRDRADGSLRERWVAEWQPCVESCQHKFGKFGRKKTFECLRQNCPEVTVVRDADDAESPELALDQSDPGRSLCARLLCADMTSSADYRKCAAVRCAGWADFFSRPAPTKWNQNPAQADVDENAQKRIMAPKSRLLLFASGLKNLCELRQCGGLRGHEFLLCAKRRCSLQATEDEGVHRDEGQEEIEEEREVRKRRVNDDVSQCIQSYCGSRKSKSERLVCIVKACHRSGR